MEKLYYSVSEVAALLGENATTVRFWSNSFSRYVSPRRNAKGNRQFTKKDLETLEKIRHLSRDCGLNLEAVGRKLAARGGEADSSLQLRSILLEIRDELQKVRESL